MTTYLKVDDGLKRSLGYLPNDDTLDDSALERMTSALAAAEFYIQSAVGNDNADFYQKDEIKELYKLACNAIAANWYDHPSTAASSTTARQIIGQLRGSYDETEVVNDDGTTTDMGPTDQ